MCGIVGWIDEQADLRTQDATLEQMVRCLIPRGPDEQGQWLSPHAALAHRRLIVLDPPGGRQPMCYQEGERTYVLTYNGEIYNFREIRAELEQLGHRFHTRSDTEVVLHAYAAWGEQCLQRFNGIFAFGLWDVQQQSLLLARDHLGVKPLFYAQRGSALLFASELKALLAHPLVEPVVGTEGLAEIFSLERSTPGCGIYRDVHEVRAGSLLRYAHGALQTQRFWTLRSVPHLDDVETTAARIRALLAEAVRWQLRADVPVVTLLSGGLDSSGVTALAGQEYARTGQPLQTYSVDFVGSAQHFQEHVLRPDQDAPWVRRVVEHVGSCHQTVVLDTPDLVEHLLVPMRAHDLPSMGQLETSLYLLCQAIKQQATVALSGESADEVFGGYTWFHDPVALAQPMFPWLAMTQVSTEHGPFSWLSADLHQQIAPEAAAALSGGAGRGAAPGGRDGCCRPHAGDVVHQPDAFSLHVAQPQGPHEHGHRPGGARPVLRLSPGGVCLEYPLGDEVRWRERERHPAPGAGRRIARRRAAPAQKRLSAECSSHLCAGDPGLDSAGAQRSWRAGASAGQCSDAPGDGLRQRASNPGHAQEFCCDAFGARDYDQ
jgi:asparagine synthase (glutamine-hydrolysing)